MKNKRLLVGLMAAVACMGLASCQTNDKNNNDSSEVTETKYNVTFNANGHGVAPQVMSNVTKLPTLTDLSADGYIFGGWYYDASFTQKASSGDTLTSNVTLYAKWTSSSSSNPDDSGSTGGGSSSGSTGGGSSSGTVEKYTITYVINGHGTQPQQVTNATSLPTTLPELTDSAYTFNGWYKDASLTIKATAGESINANTTLYAKWTPVSTSVATYSVTFVTNGHGMQPSSLSDVSTLPTTLPELTDSTMSFGGWFFDEACTQYAEAGKQIYSNVTLYAKWYTKSGVTITEASGWLESAYLEWQPVDGATSYNVYYKKTTEDDSKYVKLDKELIRKYSTYYRADAVGLAAGAYTFKLAPVFGSEEYSDVSYKTLSVQAYDRSGFAFSAQSPTGGKASGAYNADGTLRSNAQVIYVTGSNAKTVSATVNGETVTGLQAILTAKKEKGNTDILDIRIVGTIYASQMDPFGSSAEGLQIKGDNSYQDMGITIEGIGEDATIHGFGMLIRNCSNVELRNFAVMCCMDDSISVDTNNSNLWIHNLDLFYGQTGGDSDQAKGDGTIDIKLSQYITVSYNHYWDSGKASLLDAKSQSADSCVDYITMHHNWFDHSDSRHPRCRNGQRFHIYNNYYDGNAKYGIGSAVGASVFSEANYFRNCKYPFLIGTIGSEGGAVLNHELGGMIKSYADYIEGATAAIKYQTNNTQYDYYEATSRDEQINGITNPYGNSYSNFDTASTMYSYTADTPEVAKEKVEKYAGRINGGDFQYDLASKQYQQKDGNGVMQTVNADQYYGVDTEFKKLVVNYKSSLVSNNIDSSSSSGGSSSGDSGSGGDYGSGDSGSGSGSSSGSIIEGAVVHNFTTDGTTSSVFTINGSTSTDKGSTNYNNLSLTTCLKMESSTNIKFTTSEEMTLTLVFGGTTAPAGKKVKINDVAYTADSNGVVTVTLAAGTYTITKGDAIFLFLIVLQ